MKSLEELAAIRSKARGQVLLRKDHDDSVRVLVGMAECGIAAGARPVLKVFADEAAARGLSNVVVMQTDCIGICQYEPVVEVTAPDEETVTYVHMTPEKASRVVKEHLINGSVVTEYTIGAQLK